ncbi:MAG: class I SAM-dependent methyltransferase [Candidatus Eremiobacteraeota bacterium]|nr:class I SAM-dependent methyltransferase [Candidatus Eremiobacteraeota bacterium]
MNGYESRIPGPQNALDIFTGDWTSALPLPEGAGLVAGQALLFADPRVDWALAALGGVAGARVLELGPLEGGHSYMLERAGAREVIAIEGNRGAFLRCLVLKEILGLTRVRYVCGDFNPYLRETDETFDVVFATGVLYHQLDPMQMLSDIARLAPAVYLWTHYYDAASPSLSGKIGPLRRLEFQGRSYSRGEFRYMQALAWSGFCGGSQPQAHWLPRTDILDALQAFGYRDVSVAFDDPDHPNGPCVAIVARR